MFVTPDQRQNLETRFDDMSMGAISNSNAQAATNETDSAYSEATATHILWVLTQKAESRSMDVQKVLRSFDEDNDGLLNYKEFFRASAYLGLELSPHDLQSVMSHLGGSKVKPVDYTTIESKSKAIPPITHGFNTSPQAAKDLTNTYRLPKSDILCQIARKIEQQRRQFTVLRTFRGMDSDRDGYITKGEFDRGLQELGFHLSVDILSELFDRFDLMHIGKIDYTQFANIIDPSSKSRTRVQEDGVLISMPGRKRKIEPQNKGKIERPYGLETDPDEMIKEHNAYMVPKNDLLWQLAMKAEAKGRNGNFVRNVFRKFDSSQNGTVSSAEFRKGLNTVFGIEVKDDDFDELMKRFDPVNSGYVNYVEFARLINPAHYAGQSTGRMLTPSEKIALTQQKQPPVLQKVARKLQVKRNGIRMAFRGFDDNHDCLVTTKELRKVLYDILNLELTDEEFSTLISIFDPDNTGKIDHNEFVCCVDSYDHNSKQFQLHDLWNPSPVSAYRRRAYESTISESTLDFLWKLSNKMQERKKSTREIFRKYDRNHDGKLSLEEIKDCIESLGWTLKNEVLEDVFSEMDITNDGEVDYRELVKFIEVEDLRRNRLEFKSIQERQVTPPRLRAATLSVQKSDLIYQISQKIEEKTGFTAAARMFAGTKSHREGLVDEKDFREVVMKLGWVLTDEQYLELASIMHLQVENQVDYLTFLETLRSVELRYNSLTPYDKALARGTTLTFDEDSKPASDVLEDQQEQDIIHKIAQLWPDPFSFASLKLFYSYDLSRDGVISCTQFRMAMRNAQIHLTDFEFNRLLQLLRVEEESIEYESFLEAIKQVKPCVQ